MHVNQWKSEYYSLKKENVQNSSTTIRQGCLCVRPSVSSVCPSVTSDKVHVRPISKYSSIFEHIEHILENIHRICPLRPIPNRQNRPSVRPSRPSTTSLPPNTSDKTTLLSADRLDSQYLSMSSLSKVRKLCIIV
jgi:hypothetical protein